MARENLRDVEEKALRLSREGYSSSGIAQELGVTQATARKYLSTIQEEMGQAVLYDF